MLDLIEALHSKGYYDTTPVILLYKSEMNTYALLCVATNIDNVDVVSVGEGRGIDWVDVRGGKGRIKNGIWGRGDEVKDVTLGEVERLLQMFRYWGKEEEEEEGEEKGG